MVVFVALAPFVCLSFDLAMVTINCCLDVCEQAAITSRKFRWVDILNQWGRGRNYTAQVRVRASLRSFAGPLPWCGPVLPARGEQLSSCTLLHTYTSYASRSDTLVFRPYCTLSQLLRRCVCLSRPSSCPRHLRAFSTLLRAQRSPRSTALLVRRRHQITRPDTAYTTLAAS